MRDISSKQSTVRTAEAEALLATDSSTIGRIRAGTVPKGDPFPVAKVAAIMAAKNTVQMIPYCHPVPLELVTVDFQIRASAIVIRTTAKSIYKTGVEMEALSAATVGALTLYDMLKPIASEMEITRVRLLEKTGGKSDFHVQPGVNWRAGVVVISDSASAGQREDKTGPVIMQRLRDEGFEIAEYKVISDDLTDVIASLRSLCDTSLLDLVLTTGGTGLGPRDNTPEAMDVVVDKAVPGIAEALRSYGQARTPFSQLSRAKAGMRGKTLIVNFPGSVTAVTESLDALFPAVKHALAMVDGAGHVDRKDSSDA